MITRHAEKLRGYTISLKSQQPHREAFGIIRSGRACSETTGKPEARAHGTGESSLQAPEKKPNEFAFPISS